MRIRDESYHWNIFITISLLLIWVKSHGRRQKNVTGIVFYLSPWYTQIRSMWTYSTWFTWQEHNSSERVRFVLAKVECPKFAFLFLYSWDKCWAFYISWGKSERQSLFWGNSEGRRKLPHAFIVLQVIDLQRVSSSRNSLSVLLLLL